jgi:hypothetical protein
MAKQAASWTSLLRETLADDPEWGPYVRNLSPATPLRRAVTEYVRILSMRLAPTPRERRAAERILAEMERNGFASVDEYFEALDRGDVISGVRHARRPTKSRGSTTGRKPKGD